ncbi:MAG: type II toxin-antitoxin system RelE family toxin [Acidithiobacillus ferriphilus]|uniref:type II toxin-antitoxin system RelE family toxin n=1 Tax=Acidithiobacillus ferriphilus TaxID=1689834 RepID=UPI001C066865|nr:type II toxin-antitoxin system RelE/ParE family toxin [Acidithiobacillus ferriphilus]MBU2827084.1 type II toxin-antitoxin system RelE/ParE family toxin [Acidithiobacillus ferriphilus]
MAWRIRFSEASSKHLAKLDKPLAKRITAFLRECVAVLDDSRTIGDALKGPRLGEFCKYRVGYYRIICTIEDAALCILVVRVGNRRESINSADQTC